MPARKLILATRKSPLALAQSELVAAHLRRALGVEVALHPLVTTGDRQAAWSLEQQGGKGLFTGELEQALLRGEADLAVHSTKDLPGQMTAGLMLAGYLPRADARDVLVVRTGVGTPRVMATGSPRRRLQLALLFPGVTDTAIRGNVDTRLRKIAEGGLADGTVLAAAGLARLGISAWPGLTFRTIDPAQMVPAVGQGAIAVQVRAGDPDQLAGALDAATAAAVAIERALQTALGAGCHTAFGAYAAAGRLHFFHERTGRSELTLSPADFSAPEAAARRVLRELKLP